MPFVALNFLARAHLGAGNVGGANAVLTTASALAKESRDLGYGGYPPLLWELALVHLYSGRKEQALEVWRDAVDRGWRNYYLHDKGHYPLKDVFAGDPHFAETVGEIEADLERMRQTVRNNGWAETPNEFFARDRLVIGGAR